ncbi:MAG: cysteine desulfurase family protein, partial [Gibbsiella quercinecans]|uniref:cysteine desulfurase family protein n=1 Tax=Gibbsiella quercinecans TaxID=929813 RepID=UPI003F3EEF28
MIYFDNAASAMPHPDAINFVPKFGNPSSQHIAGKQSAMVISDTRKLLANLFGGEPDNYYFTSGATESANLFIQGVCRFLKNMGSHRDEIIVSAVEHPAVFNTAHRMIHLGFKVHVLPVDKNGVVNINSLKELICHKTALVCIMGVNNETGVIQPVNKAFHEVKKYDDDIITLCDSVQLLTKTEMILNLDVVDAFFSSGHKIGATKGIG